MSRLRIVISALLALTLMAGCSSNPAPSTGSETPPATASGMADGGGGADSGHVMDRPGGSESTLGGSGGAGGQGGMGGMDGAVMAPEPRIHFEFNSALLTDEAQRILRQTARYINQGGQGSVVIEGHCDERGTREYNLALGQKRADEVRDFLVAQGVDGNAVRTISYGKERPLVFGHDEFAWGQNRRAEIRVR